jgi:hypothetical protein
VDLVEDHGQVAGVVLDRRDIVDGLAQAALLGVDQPIERASLDVYEVRYFEAVLQAGEATTRTRGISTCQNGDSLGREVQRRQRRGAKRDPPE